MKKGIYICLVAISLLSGCGGEWEEWDTNSELNYGVTITDNVPYAFTTGMDNSFEEEQGMRVIPIGKK